MHIKICGIQTIESANIAVKAGADFIGFVFAPSKRQISPAHAAEISKSLPLSVKKVGVFVNETVDKINHIAETVGLDFIQLHGDEQPDFINKLSYKVIKAFPINQVDNSTLQTFNCTYYLIDSPSKEYRGGSGQTFDWNLITKLSIPPEKLILAGGLTADNVTTAISQVKPFAVDVSSGVETNGEKDHNKIKQFIFNAKAIRKDEQFDNI